MNTTQRLLPINPEAGELVMPAPTTEQERQAWLAVRQTGIGSSDIAAIMGYGYSTPLKLWLVKTGREPEFQGNDHTRWGNVQEAVICDDYAKQTGKTLKPSGLWRSRSHEWLLATPDREVLFPDDELVEAKNVGFRMRHHWENGVPAYYKAQAMWQLAATGRQRVHVVASIGGTPPQTWTIERSESQIDHMIEKATRFWRYVQEDVPPPIVDDEPEDIAKAYPLKEGEEVELDFQAEIARNEYIDARDAESEAKKRKAAAAVKIRAFMGSAEKGFIDKREAFILSVPKADKKFNETKFAQAHPEQYERFLEDTAPGAPRLTVK